MHGKNEGDITNIAVRAVNPFNPTRQVDSDYHASSQFMQDASYIKLKNIVIGYNLKKELVAKLGMEGLRIFAQGQNLFTLTDVDYIDPEYATGTGGIGFSSSIVKGFSFGINANF